MPAPQELLEMSNRHLQKSLSTAGRMPTPQEFLEMSNSRVGAASAICRSQRLDYGSVHLTDLSCCAFNLGVRLQPFSCGMGILPVQAM